MKMRDLKGMPVLALEEGERLGKVRDPLVDPATGRVLALLLDQRTPSGEPQVVASANIHHVGPAAITVANRGSVVPLSRIPRFQELARSKTRLSGKSVITEKGTKLGEVGDLIINTETFEIEGLVLKKLLGEGRRIPAEQIRTIGPDAVVVHEAPVPSKPTRTPPPSPAAPVEPQVEEEEDVGPPAPAVETAPRETSRGPLPEIVEQEPPQGEGEELEEPAIPPVSTLDEVPAAVAGPDQEPSPVEETPMEGEPTISMHLEGGPDLAPDEHPGEGAEEAGSENPWQRWVRRLRGGGEEESAES